jgi:hypothetical protein
MIKGILQWIGDYPDPLDLIINEMYYFSDLI